MAELEAMLEAPLPVVEPYQQHADQQHADQQHADQQHPYINSV
jgi:hypothetical protein